MLTFSQYRPYFYSSSEKNWTMGRRFTVKPLFSDITISIFWHHKMIFDITRKIFWCHKNHKIDFVISEIYFVISKIDFVISKNPVCGIKVPPWFSGIIKSIFDITKSSFWYHKIDFVISKITMILWYQKLLFCEVTKSNFVISKTHIVFFWFFLYKKNRFRDVTNRFFDIKNIFLYHKIEFVISKHRICDIKI